MKVFAISTLPIAEPTKQKISLTNLRFFVLSLTSTYGGEHGWWGDGQPRTLDQTFFHEQKKGGLFSVFL